MRIVMRISLLIKAIQPDQSKNPKYRSLMKTFFIKNSWKKPISFYKMTGPAITCEQALLFGQAMRASRERASEGQF